MRIPRLIALLVGTLALLSCGKPSPDGQGAKLTILSWADYVPQSVLDRFEEKFGVEVELISYESADEAFSRLISAPQNYDVAVLDDANMTQLRDRRLLLELDPAKLPNRLHLGKYAGLSFDPTNTHCMPYLWGSTVIAYDREKITPAAKSWNLLWDAQTLGDHQVFMTDEPQELFAVSLYAMNKPMNSTRPEDMAAAEKKLLDQLDHCHPAYVTPSELFEALSNDECPVAMVYNTVALCAQQENPDLEIFIPEEGAPLWFDLFAIPRETPKTDLAHQFINFMMDPETSAECAEYNSSAVANQSAEALLTPEFRGNPVIYPDERILAKCTFHDNTNPERIQLIAVHMRTVKERIQQQGQPRKPRVAVTD